VVTESTGNYTEVSEVADQLVAPTTPDGLSEAINWYFGRSQAERQDLSKVAKRRGKRFGPTERKRAFREEFEKLSSKL
jgi:hypothetical protein